MVAGVPQCTLRIYQPTPTTVRFTVSTRPAPERFLGCVTRYLLLGGRILFASIVFFTLWMKWLVMHQSSAPILAMLNRSSFGHGIKCIAERVPTLYLLPVALLITWVIVQRGYKGWFVSTLDFNGVAAFSSHSNTNIDVAEVFQRNLSSSSEASVSKRQAQPRLISQAPLRGSFQPLPSKTSSSTKHSKALKSGSTSQSLLKARKTS